MKLNPWLVLWAAPALWLTGCSTRSPLAGGATAQCSAPASPPHLQLFHSATSEDVLVQYDEWSRGQTSNRPRAFWLDQNRTRIEQQQKPRFVPLKRAQGLVSIPVVEAGATATPSAAPGLYAVVSTNGDCFTIFSRRQANGGAAGEYTALGTFKLPFYVERSEHAREVFLTPFVVAGLLVLVGGIVFALAWGYSD